MSDGCTGDAPCQWAHDLMFACHSQQSRAMKAERTFDELHATIERLTEDAARAALTPPPAPVPNTENAPPPVKEAGQ